MMFLHNEIWLKIKNEAEHVMLKEPILKEFIYKAIYQQESFSDSIAYILANKLATQDIAATDLEKIFTELFKKNSALIHIIATDLDAVYARDPAINEYLLPLLLLKGFHALQTYRLANLLWNDDRKYLAYYLQNQASLVFGVDIHPAAKIGSGIMLDHATGVVIGETCVIEDNVSILQNVTLGGTGKDTGLRHPQIRHGVMLGAGAIVLGYIEIGANAKVGAGTVVLKPVAANTTVVGVPGKSVCLCKGIPSLTMEQNIEDI